jgi:hypothetical protein
MPAAPRPANPDRLRVAAAARAMTAIIGGYALAGALSGLLARFLPIAKADASTWGLVIAFPLYAALLLWAYAERRLARVALVLWGGAAAGAAILRLVGTPA